MVGSCSTGGHTTEPVGGAEAQPIPVNTCISEPMWCASLGRACTRASCDGAGRTASRSADERATYSSSVGRSVKSATTFAGNPPQASRAEAGRAARVSERDLSTLRRSVVDARARILPPRASRLPLRRSVVQVGDVDRDQIQRCCEQPCQPPGRGSAHHEHDTPAFRHLSVVLAAPRNPRGRQRPAAVQPSEASGGRSITATSATAQSSQGRR